MNFVEKTKKYALTLYKKDDFIHGWIHIYAVRNNALKLQKILGGNKEIIEIAAYLHDCDYSKGVRKHTELSAKKAKRFLNSIEYNKTKQVFEAIKNHSLGSKKFNASLESKILFDADKIETIKPYGMLRVSVTQGNIPFKEMLKEIRIFCINVYDYFYFDETRKLTRKHYEKNKKIAEWLGEK